MCVSVSVKGVTKQLLIKENLRLNIDYRLKQIVRNCIPLLPPDAMQNISNNQIRLDNSEFFIIVIKVIR